MKSFYAILGECENKSKSLQNFLCDQFISKKKKKTKLRMWQGAPSFLGRLKILLYFNLRIKFKLNN